MNTKQRKLRKSSTVVLLSTVVLGALALPVVSSQISIRNHVFAQTSDSKQLTPGQTLDAGNHLYAPSDLTNANSWETLGTASNLTGNSFATQLVNNTKSSAGYALFNGAIDMTQPVNLSGLFTAKVVSDNIGYTAKTTDAGDALGFILTPASNAKIAANSSAAAGSNLGIAGLPNSVFVGRDFYNNPNVDTLNGSEGGSDVVAIRQTAANGALNTGNYSFAHATDKGTTAAGNWLTQIGSSASLSNLMNIQWNPETVNNDGTVTGLLTYTISSATAQTVTISQVLTLTDSMSLGVTGATGNYFSYMSFQSTADNFTAYKGTQNVQVNYLDENGQPIADSSQVLANVGDTLTISQDASSNLTAPNIDGYTFAASSPLTVANNDSTENVMNVYYTKNPVITQPSTSEPETSTSSSSTTDESSTEPSSSTEQSTPDSSSSQSTTEPSSSSSSSASSSSTEQSSSSSSEASTSQSSSSSSSQENSSAKIVGQLSKASSDFVESSSKQAVVSTTEQSKTSTTEATSSVSEANKTAVAQPTTTESSNSSSSDLTSSSKVEKAKTAESKSSTAKSTTESSAKSTDQSESSNQKTSDNSKSSSSADKKAANAAELTKKAAETAHAIRVQAAGIGGGAVGIAASVAIFSQISKLKFIGKFFKK